MIEITGTIGTAFLIVGVWANNRKRRWCFPVWMVAGLIFLAGDIRIGAVSYCVRDVILFVLAIEGWRKWK